MPKPVARIVEFSAAADADFLEIMRWTVTNFGDLVADRYEALIGQALSDLHKDALRTGAKARPELMPGLYSYHLANSRDHVVGDQVKNPRHFLIYRVSDGHVSILRILHDSRDLIRHLPAEERS